MNCTKCGAELAPESKFCVICGSPIAQQTATAPVAPVAPVEPAAPVATAAPKKEGVKIDVNAVKDQLVSTVKPLFDKVKPFLSNKKVLLGIGVVVLVLIIASVISVIASGNNGYVQLKQNIMIEEIDGEVKIIVNKKALKDTVEAEGLDDTSTSMDGKVAAFTTDEGVLYVVNGTKLKEVAEDVHSFELSVSGKGIAYVTEDEDTYTLNLYTVSNGKNATITDELGSMNYCIAPDGKSVAYYEEDDEGERKLMFSKGSDAVKITSADCDLYGMANGGKYIYVVCENEDDEDKESFLYSYDTKGERTKLGAISSSSVRFNDAHTQIMFFNDGKSYIATKGKEAEKVSSGRLNLVIAPNASSFYGGDGTTYPVSNMYDHVYTVSDDDSTTAWLIKKNDKSVKLVSKISSVRLDEKAEYLYYIYDGDELRMIKISDGDKATERYTKLADDVDGFIVTSDRKLVYFVSDSSIYSVNGKKGGRPSVVCNDDAEGWAINGKDVLYYIMDGDLYATSNGKKGSKVLSDINGLMSTENGIVYAVNDDTLYGTDGSKKPSKILDLE